MTSLDRARLNTITKKLGELERLTTNRQMADACRQARDLLVEVRHDWTLSQFDPTPPEAKA